MLRWSRKRRTTRLYREPRLPARWELFIILLTVATLVILLLEALFDLHPIVSLIVHWADNIACLLFIADFGWRVKVAERRLEFVRRNWIDLLGSIPMIDALRGVRLVRFVRLLRFTRLASLWRRLARRYDLPVPFGALWGILLLTLVIWLTAAGSFYYLEHDVNENVNSLSDALWWGMATLSTVGYGDLYPVTDGGRVVAVGTMVLGIGLLGAVAAATASAFVDFKDRGKRGLRRYVMRDHLLVLGWNDKARGAILNFLFDPRHESTDVVVVAQLQSTPMDDPRVRFVRGAPGKANSLRRASAEDAGAAIVMAADPSDPRSDHESALVVAALRRINQDVPIAVELIDSENGEHLQYAGCNALIDTAGTVANLLVRSVQDMGVSDVVTELLSSETGSELYRVSIPKEYIGRSYREYLIAMLEHTSASVIGLAREDGNRLNPPTDTILLESDEAFIVSREPPR